MKILMQAISSLEKVFPNEIPKTSFRQTSALRGEVFSFQVAYYSTTYLNKCNVKVIGNFNNHTSVRVVKLSPVNFLGDNIDNNVLRDTPGLYPDLLTPPESNFRIPQKQWRAFWITVRIPENHCGAKVKVGIELNYEIENKGKFSSETQIELEIIPVKLLEQQLLQTQWLHADCIFTYYNVECWSEAHWDLLDKYFANASSHGINLLLTPLFTPPLDTAVGGERPTTQLVDVTFTDGKYKFDFSKLERWIFTAQKNGITNFEFSHLFTQWGAEFTPKIMVTENNLKIKKFGWHMRADSEAYHKFIDAFLPQLISFIKMRGLENKSIFHVSDEPHQHHMKEYGKAVALMRKYLSGFKIIDALSNVDFLKTGLVEIPVAANDSLEDFYAVKKDDLWTYYCCVQLLGVPNRFIHFPSARSRIMGVLCYKYNLTGFLHWGYNFWYSQYSTKLINPFLVTDSDMAFAAGDPFLVYPGPDGPLDSIRHEVNFEAIQDLRALRTLEIVVGRKKVLSIIERDGLLSMTKYPRSSEWLLATRDIVNQLFTKTLTTNNNIKGK